MALEDKKIIQRVQEAILAIRNGEMIIVMDDEDRENEGDLVMAGVFSTPEKINFMATEARGLICVSITQDLALRLDLPPMVSHNNSNHETAFTISIDAKVAKTGISAYERDLTIQLMCKDNPCADDFVRPGHIFPLIAKDGGVLVRTGHTEASVDLCKMAGLRSIGVICEMMKKDGHMAKRGDKFLSEFAHNHGLKTLYVSDLIYYRMQYEKLIEILAKERVQFFGQMATKHTIADHFGNIHYAFCFQSPLLPLVKFHTIGEDLELLEDKSQFDGLMGAFELIKKEGGILIFMHKKKENKDIKDLGIGAQILHYLGVSGFKLVSLSHADESQYASLGGFHLKIEEIVHL